MTPEDQKYYEEFFAMFATEGWKQFVEQAETEKGQYNIEQLEGLDQLRYAQGMLSTLNNIIGFEERIRNTHENILNEEAEDNE